MFDVIIIGAGPAGLTAGLYAGRAKLKTLILEKDIAGGQIATTEHVENYPGSMKDAGGLALSDRMEEQAKQFCDIKYQEVTKVELLGDVKKVYTKDEKYRCTGRNFFIIFASINNSLTRSKSFSSVNYCYTFSKLCRYFLQRWRLFDFWQGKRRD